MQLGDAGHQALHGELVAGERDLARLDLGEVEDVGQDPLQQPARRDDQLGELAALGRGLLAGQGLGDGDHPVQRGAQFMAHVGEEARLLGVGPLQLRGAFADAVLQGGERGLGLLPLGPQGDGQDPDLVVPALHVADVGAIGRFGVAGRRQPLDRPHDAAPRHQHHRQGLDQRGDAADQQHPGRRARRRGHHIGLGIGQQEIPVGAVEPTEGDDLAAVGAVDHPVLAAVLGDGGDQAGQGELLLVLGEGLLRRAALVGEARIGDQLALRGDDQGRGARRRVLQGAQEEVGQLHGRAEGADVAAVHIGRRQAGRGQPLADIVLDQPLQVRAARHSLRVEGGKRDLGHLLAGDAEVGGRVVTVEHQVVGPIGPVHHQPGLPGGEEIEVVVVTTRRLTEVPHQLEGGHQDLQFLRRDRLGVSDEGAHAVGEVAVLHDAVEVLWAAAAGAVALRREIGLGLSRHLGVGQLAHPPLQFLGGGLVKGRKVGEAAIHIAAALPDIVREIADLPARQLAFEDDKGAEGAEHRHDQRHQADADQEPTRKRFHWVIGTPLAFGP